jgi:hypothetical protein
VQPEYVGQSVSLSGRKPVPAQNRGAQPKAGWEAAGA